VVVGSSNMDLVVKTARVPTLGETILGGDFLMVPGGKGANQAVAAAKLGALVHFVARLGDDVFGRQSLANFEQEGVITTHVALSPDVASGVALITVDAQGNNVIVVAPGANSALSTDDVERAAADIHDAGAVVAQLEVPLATVRRAAQLAHESGVPFILDPAPARDLPAELLGMVSVLTPNETEAQILTGVNVLDEASAGAAAQKLLAKGVEAVVVTMGGQGFMLAKTDSMEFIPAPAVRAVDATAAGDAFAGSLAVGVAQGQSLRDAAVFAGRTAALSVTKMGAQPSMPTRQEVELFAG
jgi:ribokinase